jgi:hypothetical protein
MIRKQKNTYAKVSQKPVPICHPKPQDQFGTTGAKLQDLKETKALSPQ